MMFSSKIKGVAVLAGAVAVHAGGLQAAELSSHVTMKPLHGVSFEIGTQSAVSYFLSDNGRCKLVLTLSNGTPPAEAQDLNVTRFEAAVPAAAATRIRAAEGKSLEFACAADAQAMIVRAVDHIAAEAPPVN